MERCDGERTYDHMNEEMTGCIETCLSCYKTCLSTAMTIVLRLVESIPNPSTFA